MARVAFLGSKRVGLSLLETMTETVLPPHQIVGVLTLDDAEDDRSEVEGFRELADSRGLNFACKGPAVSLDILRDWGADVAIVSGWYELIDINAYESISFYGFHFSSLPRFRGSAPLVWQIMSGASEVGLSFFRFGEGIDDGDIVDQEMLPLGKNESIADALHKVEEAARFSLRRNLSSVLNGDVELRKQDESKASYCSLRVPEDGCIDWSLSARKVHDFIRAQTRPYPGAYAFLPDGHRVYIWRSELLDVPYFGVPGGIAARETEAVVVTCGDGAVRILEVQAEGSEPSVPRDLFRSVRLRLRSDDVRGNV